MYMYDSLPTVQRDVILLAAAEPTLRRRMTPKRGIV